MSGGTAVEVDGLPLHGLSVVDFSQFLAGPSCALRLADLGADVIKIERPEGGDICRQLYFSNLQVDGDSTLFHAINRNKRSYAANLKDPHARAGVERLVKRADVVISNFRPGVMERLRLGYDDISRLNPRAVYATVTGYSNEGPWRDKPGQDLLAQSVSGLTWLSGDADQGPVPMGIAVADILAGAHLAQGILACLVRRAVTGRGGMVEVSLLESVLDLQFEALTTFLNDGGKPPQRSATNSAHAYLSAPYGIYETADGYLALAMGSIPRLGELLDCPALLEYTDPADGFLARDEIKAAIAERLQGQPTSYWLSILEPADFWCADVLTWSQLMVTEGFAALRMTQRIGRPGATVITTRCPIRVDGSILTSTMGAPKIGEHNGEIDRALDLDGPPADAPIT